MQTRSMRIAPAAIAAAAVLGCSGQGTEKPASVAERFYAAVEQGDGERACGQLSPDAVSELESQEQSPCAEAVLELKLSGARAREAEAYVTTARVEMDAGDRVFLDETPDGWRVAAAGCRPEPGEEAPHQCEVEA